MIKFTSGEEIEFYAIDCMDLKIHLHESYMDCEWLSRVNSLELRTDGTLGLGYFLISKQDYESIQDLEDGFTVYFTETVYFKVHLMDALHLDNNAHNFNHVVIIVQEQRSQLQYIVLDDNYNVIDMNTYKDIDTFKVFEAESLRVEDESIHREEPYTWAEIFEEIGIRADITITLQDALPSYTPYNVLVAGMTVFEALSYITRVHGYGFSMVEDEVFIFKRKPVPPEPEQSDLGEFNAYRDTDEIKITSMTVGFPYMYSLSDNQLDSKVQYKTFIPHDDNVPGYNKAICIPFYPALSDEDNDNFDDLDTFATEMYELFEEVYENRVSRVEITGWVEPFYINKKCDSITILDDGIAQKTVYLNNIFDHVEIPNYQLSTQSIEPFKYEVVLPYSESSPTAATVKVIDPTDPDEYVWIDELRMDRLFILGKDPRSQVEGEQGHGIRVGQKRYTLGSNDEKVQYEILSMGTGTGPLAGVPKATALVYAGPGSLIGKTISVYDHSRCIFDQESMTGYTGWAYKGQVWSLDTEDPCETLTPYHWIADNRCCDPDTAVFRGPCEGGPDLEEEGF